jgi:hypothetical protein
MILKRLLVLFVFFLLYADAKRLGRGIRIRTGIKIFYEYKINILYISNIGSSSNSSDKTSSNPVKTIIGIIVFLLSCGCGIIWRFYMCLRSERIHRQQMGNYICVNPPSILIVDRLNTVTSTEGRLGGSIPPVQQKFLY